MEPLESIDAVIEAFGDPNVNTVLFETTLTKKQVRQVLITENNLPVEIEEMATVVSTLSEIKTFIIQRIGTRLKRGALTSHPQPRLQTHQD